MRSLPLPGLLGALALPLLAAPAAADAGVRPIWNDFQPAVSTQYRPPDGGWHYRPPNTRALIRDRDRQALPSKGTEIDRTTARRSQPVDPLRSPRRGAPTSPPGGTLAPLPSDPPVRQIDQMGR